MVSRQSRSGSRSRSKSKSKSRSPLNPNIMHQIITEHANTNALGTLAGVNKTTRNFTKAEYDKRMPKTPLRHTKTQLVDKIWYMLTQLYGDEYTASTEWPEDIGEFFNIIGTFPNYQANPTPYETVYKFNSKRGYLEFMKRLSKEKVFGLYCWMNGRLLDYFRVKSWFGDTVQLQKMVLQDMTSELERPAAMALKNGL